MESINEIDDTTTEGRLLLMAIAKITSEHQTSDTPDYVLQQIVELSAKVYSKPKFVQ